MKRIATLAIAALLIAFNASAQRDTTRVLIVGNSFTFVNETYDMLSKIALSQGHYLDIVQTSFPGYTFANHLANDSTTEAILKGDYEYAILQDQSQNPAKFANDPVGNASIRGSFITLCNRIFGWSPGVKVIVECTWSYPADNWGGFNSESNFDNLLQNGTRLYTEIIRGTISPIGNAFTAARHDRQDIELLDKDGKHQSAYGAYLKSCINYLVLFGGKFSSDADNCGLDPEKAKYLRNLARKTVNR